VELLWRQEHKRLVTHLSYRGRRSAPWAEDIVSDAFAYLLRKHHDHASPGYLWRVAFSAAADVRRHEKRQDFLEEQVGILTGTAIPGIDTAIMRMDFLRAFRQLPLAQREAFALIELRGLTALESAQVLGIPRRTVTWRCEAARTYLAKELS
jgi:RNA polymerase sigma factor (sigma-70 family)